MDWNKRYCVRKIILEQNVFVWYCRVKVRLGVEGGGWFVFTFPENLLMCFCKKIIWESGSIHVFNSNISCLVAPLRFYKGKYVRNTRGPGSPSVLLPLISLCTIFTFCSLLEIYQQAQSTLNSNLIWSTYLKMPQITEKAKILSYKT